MSENFDRSAFLSEELRSAIDDPKHENYLKFCFVCQEEAKPGQEHIRNYGGIVCFSCRAFFRRAHQKSRIPRFVCKKNGHCTLTPSARRRCQQCRYERCIRAGMKPDLVLSEDQKLIRFRKILHRKRSGTETIAKRKENKVKSVKSDGPSTSGVSSTRTKVKTENYLLEFGATSETLLSTNLDDDLGLEDDLNEGELDLDPVNLLFKAEEIVESYKKAILQCSAGKSSQYFETLVSFHLGVSDIQLDKKDVLTNMLSFSTVFYQFAQQQSEFVMLSKVDQKKLIDRNTPLFIQLLIASYFGAENGTEQLELILDFCHSSVEINPFGDPFFMSLQNFNTISKLFKFDSDLVYFLNLISKVRSVRLFGIEQQALMAYMVLFDTSSDLDCDFEAITKRNEQIYYHCVEKINPEITMQEVSFWLIKMAVFSSYNIVWNEKELPSPELTLTMVYTQEEERWLQNQLELLETAFRSVPIGEEIIEEFAMYSLGVPVSKSNLPRVFNVYLERILRMFKTQSEGLDLTSEIQMKILNKNSLMAFCIMASKWDSFKTGIDQLQYSLGLNEGEFWAAKYEKVFAGKELKKLDILDASHNLKNALSDDQKCEMMKAFKDLSGLVSDPIIYGLMLLLTLSQPVEDVFIGPVVKLNYSYSLLMKRRMTSQLARKETETEPIDPSQFESKISTGFTNVEKLTKMFAFLNVQ